MTPAEALILLFAAGMAIAFVVRSARRSQTLDDIECEYESRRSEEMTPDELGMVEVKPEPKPPGAA